MNHNIELIDGKRNKRGSIRYSDTAENFYLKRIEYMDIADMKLSGISKKEIAKKINRSTERVRQILKKYFFDIEFSRDKYEITSPRKNARSIEEITCKYCKKSNQVKVSKSARKKIFCDRNCFWKSVGRKKANLKKMNIEQKREYNRKRTKRYYHKHKKDPHFKAQIAKYNKRAMLKLKNKREKSNPLDK